MAAQALYRKWRSQTFDEVIGQEHVTRTLRNALRDGRIAHAYLFSGPRGTGKTSTARLLAKAVNCLQPEPAARPDNTCSICQAVSSGTLLDLIEIDAASNRGIDEIRDLRDKVHFAPSRARYKVYVIDEVHMLTPEAFNALLKTLEEPPPHVIFVLATTEPHKIPDTVLSRCQRFDFRRIPTHEIVNWLEYILEQEGRSAEPAALEMIARSAEGSMRDAISLVDQLLSYGSDGITEAQVRAVRGTVSGQAIHDFADAIAVGNVGAGLALINRLAAEGMDLRQLVIQLTAHLRSVLLARVSGGRAEEILSDLSADELAAVRVEAERFDASMLAKAIRQLNDAGAAMRDAVQPQLTLELAWLDACQPTSLVTPVSAETEERAVAVPVAASPSAETSFGARERGAPAPPLAGISSSRPASAPQPSSEAALLPRSSTAVPDEQVPQVLRANWTALLQAAETSRGGSLRGALRTLRNVVASGDDVYFAFENEFSRSTVERSANKVFLQELIGQLLGRSVRLHCQVGAEVKLPISEQPSSPSQLQTSAETQGLIDDPVVEHARRHLGAVPRSAADNSA